METKLRTVSVKTSKGPKEYTFLGCPHTRNRTPWCFRLCSPGEEGEGDCGRVAPHSLRGRTDHALQVHHRKRVEEHLRKLERMYLAGSANQYLDAGIEVSDGKAEIVVPIQEKFLDATGAVHESIYFGAMVDAARFAATSAAGAVVLTAVGFTMNLAGSVSEGDILVRARLMGNSEGHFLVEAALTDSKGEEIGRANGAFTGNGTELTEEMGYR